MSPPVTTITSRQNAVVGQFRAAARSGSPRDHLLLDGLRLINDAHQAEVPIEVALFASSQLAADDELGRLAHSLKAAGVRVLLGTEAVLRAASPVRSPSGAVALATHRPPSVDRIVAEGCRGLLLAAVGVQDPGNLGAIIRAADAGGARGVVTTRRSADPFGWRALRGAMGSSFRIPVGAVEDVRPLVAQARAQGAQIVAAVPRGGTAMYDADLSGRRLVLVGQEGAGLEQDLGREADLRVSIPMRRLVDSLNVAVAAALIIYEARRQRLRHRRGRPRTGRSRRSGPRGPAS